MRKTTLKLKSIFLLSTIIFLSNAAFAETKSSCDDKNQICAIMDVKKDYVEFAVGNKTEATRTAKLSFTTENIKSSNKVPEYIVIKPKEKIIISKLTPVDPKLPISLKYNIVTNVIGDINKEPLDYVYELPFEKGKAYKLIQGFNGEFTHNKKDTAYALDFKMPEGTAVYAARDGRVVEVIDEFSKGGKDKSLEDKANLIYIEHSDGTYGAYLHLKNKGALVKAGDKVKRGQKIALSGFTGYGDTPHLHFAVLKGGKDMIERSIRFKFESAEGLVTKPEQGKTYTAK